MSRAIANPGLADLCSQLSFDLGDLASLARTNRRALWQYVNGRPSPRLEARLADIFGLSVKQLRKKLGLQNAERGK